MYSSLCLVGDEPLIMSMTGSILIAYPIIKEFEYFWLRHKLSHTIFKNEGIS